jgi:hypothetical protein
MCVPLINELAFPDNADGLPHEVGVLAPVARIAIMPGELARRGIMPVFGHVGELPCWNKRWIPRSCGTQVKRSRAERAE